MRLFEDVVVLACVAWSVACSLGACPANLCVPQGGQEGIVGDETTDRALALTPVLLAGQRLQLAGLSLALAGALALGGILDLVVEVSCI